MENRTEEWQLLLYSVNPSYSPTSFINQHNTPFNIDAYGLEQVYFGHCRLKEEVLASMFKLFHPHFLSKHIPWKFQLKFFYDSYDPQTTTFMITSMIYHEMSRPLTFLLSCCWLLSGTTAGRVMVRCTRKIEPSFWSARSSPRFRHMWHARLSHLNIMIVRTYW